MKPMKRCYLGKQPNPNRNEITLPHLRKHQLAQLDHNLPDMYRGG